MAIQSNTFSSFLRSRYLFHLHTDFVDGELSIADYFQFARKNNVEVLVFLEHIRKEPTYDVDRYVAQIRENSKNGVHALVGFEAKILSNGTLDIPDHCINVADVIGFAEHGGDFEDVCSLYRCIAQVVNRYSRLVWVHPGLWLKRKKIWNENLLTYLSLLQIISKRSDILIEQNKRYDLVPVRFAKTVPNSHRVIGLDSHRFSDLSIS